MRVDNCDFEKTLRLAHQRRDLLCVNPSTSCNQTTARLTSGRLASAASRSSASSGVLDMPWLADALGHLVPVVGQRLAPCGPGRAQEHQRLAHGNAPNPAAERCFSPEPGDRAHDLDKGLLHEVLGVRRHLGESQADRVHRRCECPVEDLVRPASPRAARLIIAGSIWMSANLLMSQFLDAGAAAKGRTPPPCAHILCALAPRAGFYPGPCLPGWRNW